MLNLTTTFHYTAQIICFPYIMTENIKNFKDNIVCFDKLQIFKAQIEHHHNHNHDHDRCDQHECAVVGLGAIPPSSP